LVVVGVGVAAVVGVGELPVGVVRIEGGWRVWSSARFHVDVLAMLGGNLRVVTTPVERPLEYTRAWCFQRSLVEVVLLALAFDPDDVGSEPVGWVKQVGSERRPCGWLAKSVGRLHVGFEPACVECGDESLA
jgi:hypothetical protein